MESFFTFVYVNPYLSVAYVFAFFAALAFLVFFRGFLSGFVPVFTMEGHDGFMALHRTRAVWGVLLLLMLFTIWEIIRAGVGLFTDAATPSLSEFIGLAITWAILFVFYQLAIKPTK